MYKVIGVLYVVVMIAFLLLPFFKMAKAKKFALTFKDKVIEGRYDLQMTCKSLLSHFHDVKRESVIVLFMDDKNKCIDVRVRFGSKNSIKSLTKEICKEAPRIKAGKIIVACNHNVEKTTATRADLLHAATLYANLPEGVKLAGYVVWCKNQAVSLLDSYEFKQMIAGYIS